MLFCCLTACHSRTCDVMSDIVSALHARQRRGDNLVRLLAHPPSCMPAAAEGFLPGHCSQGHTRVGQDFERRCSHSAWP